MRLIYLGTIIDFQGGKYYIDYIVQQENGQLLTCKKECANHAEATKLYKELEKIRDHDNPSNAIIVDKDNYGLI